MENASKKKISDKLLIKMILSLKKMLPNSYFFCISFLFFKYLGLLIHSNNLDKYQSHVSSISVSSFSMSMLLKKLTFFGNINISSETSTSFSLVNYNVLCVCIYLILVLLVIGYYYIYHITCSDAQWTFSTLQQSSLGVSYEIKTGHSILLKLLSIVVVVIFFLSQHILEILCFPFIFLMNTSSEKIKTAEAQLMMGYTVYIVINSVFILMIDFCVFYFLKIINDPYISPKYKVKYSHNNAVYILLTLVFNLQCFHFYDQLFSDSEKICIVMMSASLILVCLILFLSFNNFIFPTMCNYFQFSLIFFCFYSSIVNIIVYYSIENEVNIALIAVKIAVELILTFISVYACFYFNRMCLQFRISENIFRKNKQIKSQYIYELVNLLKMCLDDFYNFTVLFSIIEIHKMKCFQSNDCNCKDFEIQHFTQNFNNKSDFMKLKDTKRILEFRRQFLDLIVLVENEIVSFISTYNRQSGDISTKFDIFLLHCDFIFYFQRNFIFSLYLIQEYFSKLTQIPIEFSIYFNYLQLEIIQERRKGHLQDITDVKISSRFENFLRYYQEIQKLKVLVSINCEQFERMISFKKIGLESSLERLFDECFHLNKTNDLIISVLLEKFSKIPLRNPEVCYVLSNFFEITGNGIPKQLNTCFMEMDSYQIVESFDSSYLDMKFDHPLIMHLRSSQIKNSSDFIIEYISQKLCNSLGYSRDSLINTEFHSLLPKLFAEEHKLEMKRYILLKEIFKVEKDTFVLSKDQYYERVHVACASMPSLSNDVLLICDIKTLNLFEQEHNWFLFILDSESNIITMSRNFEAKYKLNYEMLTKLKISFCYFFEIDIERLKNSFTHTSTEQLNSDTTENLVTVFSHTKLCDNLKAYRESSKTILNNALQDGNQKKIIHKLKEKLIPVLQKIKKSIEEQEYDENWLSKINYLENMFYSQYIPRRVIIGQIGDTSNQRKGQFHIHIKNHKIGKLNYFYIKLYDKEENVENEKKGELTAKSVMKSFKYETVKSSCQSSADFEKMRRYYDNFNKATSKSNNNDSSDYRGGPNESTIPLKNKNEEISNITGILNASVCNSPQVNILPGPYQSSAKYTTLILEVNKKLEKCLFYSLYIMAFVILCFFAGSFDNKNRINYLTELFGQSNQNVLQIKQRIYQTSTLLSSLCFRVDNLEDDPLNEIYYPVETMKRQLKENSRKMFDYFNDYEKFLVSNMYYEGIEDIYSVFFEQNDYRFLNPDWTYIMKTSTFETQMHWFHFHTAYIQRNNSMRLCRVKEFFLDGKYETIKQYNSNSTLSINMSMSPASEDEMLFYYLISNVIPTFTEKIEKVITTSNNIVYSLMSELSRDILLFETTSLILALLIVTVFSWMICIYRNQIYSNLVIFLNSLHNTSILERKLRNFQTILLSFDHNVCSAYEKKKKEIKKTNGDCIFLLRSNANQSLNSNININTGIRTADENCKVKIKYGLNIVKFSAVMICIAFCGYCGIIISYIFFSDLRIKETFTMSQLAFSYMNRYAKLNELALYFRISVMLNNPNYVTVQPEMYPSLDNHHSSFCSMVDVNRNDTRYQLLGNSKFAHIYSQFQKEVIIQSKCKEIKNNIFQNRVTLGKLLSTNKSCDNYVDSYTKYIDNEIFTPEELAQFCKKISYGINLKGIITAFEAYSSLLLDLYLEFYKEHKTMSSKDTIITTLMNFDVQSIFRQCELSYMNIWELFNWAIKTDFENYSTAKNRADLWFEVCGFVFNFCFLGISLIFVLSRIRKYHHNFIRALRKLLTSVGEERKN